MESARNTDIQLFSETLKTNTTLTKLALQFCENGGIFLGNALKKNRSVQSLTLNYNSMNITHLFNSLKENETLTELTMKNQTLYHGDVAALSTLFNTNTTLTTLHLGWEFNMMITILGTNEVCAVADLLKTNTTLKNFSLATKNIGWYDRTMQSFAEALTVNKTLKKLTLHALGNFTMRNEGVVLVAEALKVNTSLMELNLQGIDFLYPKMHNITDIRDFLKALPELAQAKPNYIVVHDPQLGTFNVVHKSILDADEL